MPGRRLTQRAELHILRNPDDFGEWTRPIRDALTEHVRAKHPRRRLAQDDHRRMRGVVALGEIAARDQRDAGRMEIGRPDERGDRRVVVALRLSFDAQAAAVHAAAERRLRGECRVDDVRLRAHLLENLAAGRRCRTRAVCADARAELDEQHVPAIDSELLPLESVDAADQKSGDDEQRDGESDLNDDQRAAEARHV